MGNFFVAFISMLRYNAFAEDVHFHQYLAADTGRAKAPEDASDGRRCHGIGHREFDSMTFKPFDIAIYILN